MSTAKIKDAMITTAVVLGVVFALNQVPFTRPFV